MLIKYITDNGYTYLNINKYNSHIKFLKLFSIIYIQLIFYLYLKKSRVLYFHYFLNRRFIFSSTYLCHLFLFLHFSDSLLLMFFEKNTFLKTLSYRKLLWFVFHLKSFSSERKHCLKNFLNGYKKCTFNK